MEIHFHEGEYAQDHRIQAGRNNVGEGINASHHEHEDDVQTVRLLKIEYIRIFAGL
jgi:hypothetical protein